MKTLSENFYCIGDSHISIFAGTDLKQPNWPESSSAKLPNFQPYKLGPVTAYNLCSYGTRSQGREKLNSVIRGIPSGSNIILCFGEIDCRVHILKVADEQNEDWSVIVEDVVDRYFDVILELQSRKFKMFILSVSPSAWATMVDPGNTTYEWFIYGTTEQRNAVSKMFNNQLAQKCKDNDIHFINIFDKFVDLDQETRHEFFPDGFHLCKKGLPTIIDSLERSLNE